MRWLRIIVVDEFNVIELHFVTLYHFTILDGGADTYELGKGWELVR
jgi:hypothetical protein